MSGTLGDSFTISLGYTEKPDIKRLDLIVMELKLEFFICEIKSVEGVN